MVTCTCTTYYTLAQMNPWVYTLPHGEGKELDLDSLTYDASSDFFEENNHPGRYEDKKVHAHCKYVHVCKYVYVHVHTLLYA